MIKKTYINEGNTLYLYFLGYCVCFYVKIWTHYVERYFLKEKILNEPEAEVPLYQQCLEKGWLNCLLKMNINADICFFGNSITRNSDFGKYFRNMSIVNLGVGGDNLDDLLRRVPMVVFVMGGLMVYKT